MNAVSSKMVKAVRSEAIKTASELMLVAFASVLYDKMGLSDEDVKRALQETVNVADSVNKDYVTFEDYKKALFEEHGIRIDFLM